MIDNKINIYASAFKIFLNEDVPYEILLAYVNHPFDEQAAVLQDFIGMHLKEELLGWSTAIGVMDAVDVLYKEAYNNGNLKDYGIDR